MIKYISIGIGILSFSFWMSMVGNPHYIETCIGLIIGFGFGFFSNKELHKLAKKFK